MSCTKCGFSTKEGDMFCTNCGNQLTSNESKIDEINYTEVSESKLIIVAYHLLNVMLLNIITMPIKIYLNSFKRLATHKEKSSEKSTLQLDFPIFTWLLSIIDGVNFLSYPIAIIIAIIKLLNSESEGLLFYLILAYFYPMFLGVIREYAQLFLKALQYLKTISNNITNSEN